MSCVPQVYADNYITNGTGYGSFGNAFPYALALYRLP